MYKIANSTAYEFDQKEPTKVTKPGIDATKFWSENKLLLISPTVLNSLSIVLIALVYMVG